jgi:hypothetical protein
VHLLGTIEPNAQSTIGKADWVRLVEAHPQLSQSPPQSGTNPFTKGATLYRPDPTSARVVVGVDEVGVIHWAMDGSARLLVWAQPASDTIVGSIAEYVAARLEWRFVHDNAAQHLLGQP